MNASDINHEENIAKILGKMNSIFKEVGLSELSEKSEMILSNYHKSKYTD